MRGQIPGCSKLIVLSFLVLGAIVLGFSHSARSDELQDNFMQGDLAYQSGDFKKAIQFYENVVKINPDFAPAYNALGLAHLSDKDKISNITWFFNVALEIDPQYVDAYSNLCRAYYEYQMFDEAEAACSKALEIKPDYGPAQLSLAWVYLLGKKNPEQAIPYFDQILQKTKNPVVLFSRGIAYGEVGDSARVIETITMLRELGKEDLAVQLESSLRASAMPPTDSKTLELPERQPGTIVPTNVPQSSVISAPSEPVSQDSLGSMRIRLKGKLSAPMPAVPQ
jgi:tetratricopeptide (TPR) repeat protein